MTFNIVCDLRSGLMGVVRKDCWKYKDENKNEIVIFIDWLEGLQERYGMDTPIPHGQYAIIKKEFLDETFQKHGLRLGYILKTVYRTHKHSYSEIETIDNVKFLNVSNVII